MLSTFFEYVSRIGIRTTNRAKEFKKGFSLFFRRSEGREQDPLIFPVSQQ